MLTERDLQIIQDNIGRIIELMETHGCVNPPDIHQLKLISKNIRIYRETNVGLEELDEYIREDWQEAFRSQLRIIDCYIPSDDIDLKAAYNTEFEGCSSLIEYTLHKNWGRRRKWYTRHALESIGKKSNNAITVRTITQRKSNLLISTIWADCSKVCILMIIIEF